MPRDVMKPRPGASRAFGTPARGVRHGARALDHRDPSTRKPIRAITESVGDPGQIERVREQLPPDLARLFGPAEESGGRYRSASGG